MLYRLFLFGGYLLYFFLVACNSGGGGGPASDDNDDSATSNTQPVFTSPDSVMVAENQLFTGYTARATDADNDSVSFRLDSSNDFALFSLNHNSGRLYFTTIADFENPSDTDRDNRYHIRVIAEDGKGGKQTLDVTVTVTDANDMPRFTSVDQVDVTENIPGAAHVVAATDQDGDALTYAIEDLADGALFQINSISGRISFVDTPDFETPLDQDNNNIYELVVSVTDALGASQLQSIFIRVNDVSQFQNRMLYPTPNANLGGLVNESTIVGRVQDLEDHIVSADDIVAIYVNGQTATLSMDNPGVWSARVPVVLFSNALSIVAEFTNGDSLAIQQHIDNQVLLSYISSISLDAANNRLFAVDPFEARLLSIDLHTGNKTIVSDNRTGSGPQFDGPLSVAYNPVTENALVLDVNTDWLLSIDLVSGDRTDLNVALSSVKHITLDIDNNRALISRNQLLSSMDLTTHALTTVSSSNRGTGTNYSFLNPVTLDNDNNRALYTSLYALNEVDLTTGDRNTISGLGGLPVGSGPSLENPLAVGLAAAGDIAYVADSQRRAILAVDMASGDRSYCSSNTDHSGPDFILPTTLLMDDQYNRILVGDPARRAVFAVDPATGSRSYVASNSVGSGTHFHEPYPVTVDGLSNRAFVGDSRENVIFSVDLTTGNRTILASEASSFSPRSMDIDRAHNRLLVISSVNNLLMGYDLTSGVSNVVSGGLIGSGNAFDQPVSVVVDTTMNNRAYVLDRRADAIYAVDLDNGNRTIISSTSSGQPNFDFAEAIAIDSNANRLLVLSRAASNYLIAVNPENGSRHVVSSSTIGGGTGLSFPRALSLDNENNRAIITDQNSAALVGINLESGDRSIISNINTGTGPNFDVPRYHAFDRLNRRLLVSDDGLNALVVVEMTTGERAITSH